MGDARSAADVGTVVAPLQKERALPPSARRKSPRVTGFLLLAITIAFAIGVLMAAGEAPADGDGPRRASAVEEVRSANQTGPPVADGPIEATDDDWRDGIPVGIETGREFLGTWIDMVGPEKLLLAVGVPILLVSWLLWLRSLRTSAGDTENVSRRSWTGRVSRVQRAPEQAAQPSGTRVA
jgi:hypothetical protein